MARLRSSIAFLVVVLVSVDAARSEAAAAKPTNSVRDPLPTQLRQSLRDTLDKLHVGEITAKNGLPELDKHLAAGKAAFGVFRAAKPGTSLPMALNAARGEYSAADAVADAALRAARAVRDANLELQRAISSSSAQASAAAKKATSDKSAAAKANASQTKAIAAEVLKTIGVGSDKAQAAKADQSGKVVEKLEANQMEAKRMLQMLDGASAAPNAQGPGKCDIRSVDWLNFRYPNSQSQSAFQLKRGTARQDAGPDPMGGGERAWVFEFAGVSYGDTDHDGAPEAFVHIAVEGYGYQMVAPPILFAFEDDTACQPKAIAASNLQECSTPGALEGDAYVSRCFEQVSKYWLSNGELIASETPPPKPVPCPGGLLAGKYKSTNSTLLIPADCSAPSVWFDRNGGTLAKGVIHQETLNGKPVIGLYTVEGDPCGFFALKPGKGTVTATWTPEEAATINHTAAVSGCKHYNALLTLSK